MRTIMVIALAANIFLSVGANYVQGALTGHSVSVAGSTQK